MESLSFQRAYEFQLNVIQQFEQRVSFGRVLFTNQKFWCWCNERNKLSTQSTCIPLSADGSISVVVVLVSICTAYADWGHLF